MAHPTPRTYVLVFAGLIALTITTVGLSFVDLGEWHAPVGLVIAAVKASLVVLFFMHLFYSSKLTKVTVIAALFFLFLLLSLSMTDYLTRGWLTNPLH